MGTDDKENRKRESLQAQHQASREAHIAVTT